MSVVVLCSAKGSPGVTTTALALATSASLRSDTILVEADPSGGDLALRLGFAPTPGLASLAAAGRRELNPALVEQHCQTVVGIDIVGAPVGAAATRSALAVLGETLPSTLAAMRSRIVVCDIGRLDPGSASLGVVKVADLILVVVRPLLSDLGHVAEQQGEWSRLGARLALVLSGEPGTFRRERYPASEVSDALGLEVLGTLAWDPRGVSALMSDQHDSRRSALTHSARSLAERLARQLDGKTEDAVPGLPPRQSTGPTRIGAEL